MPAMPGVAILPIALLGAAVGSLLRRSSARVSPCPAAAAELAGAVAFTAVAAVRGVDRELLLELPFVTLLLAVAAVDLEHRIVPNRLLLPAAAYVVVASAALRPARLPELALAGAAAFASLLAIALAWPGGLGMGDVKLAGVMGLYLGGAVAPALLAAFGCGAAAGAALVVRRGWVARRARLPFAPFLALGGLVGLLRGAELVELYADAALG
jgi:leader peptidase (prepilin peptidase) / N-methyltransferase